MGTNKTATARSLIDPAVPNEKTMKAIRSSRAGKGRSFPTAEELFKDFGQMIIPGSSYWNVAIGRDPGEVLNDEEGIQTMKTLGQNMAWLLKKINR